MISPKIRILKRSQIDDAKWDQAVAEASNSLPYAYTWYLDALCPRWIAMIVGDYEHIMPLPIHRKWGFLYVYQPLFCQQLGVFYQKRSNAISELIYKAVLGKFIFVNLNGNYDNLPAAKDLSAFSGKKNLIIPLTQKHTAIQKNFTDNTVRNIKKGQKAGLTFAQAEKKELESFVDFYTTHTAAKDKKFKTRHATSLRRLVHQFIIHDCGKLYIAKTIDGAICAGVIVVENNERIIHLLPASDTYGRQNGGMHFLLNEVLKHYETSGKTYDLEGSSVESIARFYEGFGASQEPFFVISKRPFGA